MKHRQFHISFALPVSVDLGINPLYELLVAVFSPTFTSSGGFRSFVMTQLSGFIAQMKIVSDWDHGSSMTLTCVASLLPSNHKSHVFIVLSGSKKRGYRSSDLELCCIHEFMCMHLGQQVVSSSLTVSHVVFQF